MSTEQQNASSSSYRCTYDAFLSFRGADTRKGFADHLYSALELAGIHTFRDHDEIEGGANIEQELQTAIQESRVSVIVFSTDYASSTWCLNELAIIMERTKTDGHKVVPVFYDVEPSDVRKQTGSFADSFTRHEERFKDKIDKVEEWRRALREVTDLGGMVLGERYESQFIQDIVEAVGNKLDYMNMWKRRLRVDPYVIGRDYYVESLNTWLEDGSNDVGVAAIHGMGGIGKTTIAKIAYNQNFSKFQASSFLSDIRETSKQANGFVHLQRNLLSDIQKRKVNNIYSHDEGIVKIKRAVRCKRVLIVLDDVENLEQFNVILGMRDWLHPGSKIIITTRHEHLLRAEVCVRFKVKGLPEHQSLKLFSWHAFGQPHPQEGYMDLSRPVVEHCGGVPLALQVLGSSLFGKTDVWKNALHNLDVITEGKIQKILGISFHSLQDHVKRLFLHIACFFVGKDKDFTTTILDECDFATEVGLQHLVDRCLVEINVHNKLIVHQLLQDMGRAIIHEESPEDPGKRTRLWHKDAFNVLTKLTGTRTIKGLMLYFLPTDSSPVNEVGFKTKAFTEMLNLELLLLDNVKLSGSYEDFPKKLIWLSWRGLSLKSIPANFCLENLVALDLRKSSLQRVWKGTRFLTRLKILNLSHSHGLRTTSDLSGLPNLEKLILKDCINLIDVDESIGNLGKLVFLNLKDCKSLTKLPKIMNMLRSLEELNLSGCSKLLLHDSATVIHLHAISRDMNRPRLLSTLSWTPIRSWWMWAWPGKTLQSTSFSLASLPRCLGSLNLSDCNLSEVPNDLCTLSSLKKLDLTDNPILCLPQNMKSLIMLETLLLKNCTNLEMLPELPARLETLVAFGCESLKRLTNLPNLFKSLDLNFGGCPQLVEVESLLNIKTLISLFNMESIASTDDEMLNNLTDTTRKVPVQVFFDFRTYSIFLHASKIPDGFDFTSKIPDGFDFTTHKPVLSFIPPLHPNHKSLNVAVLYAKNEHQIKASGLNMIHVQVIHEKGGSTGWTHSLRTVGLPTENGDVLWLCHIQFESKERECVRVSVEMSDFYRVKELGIQLLYAQNNVVAGQVSLSASPYGHRMGPLSYYGRLPRTCFIEKVDS
ncbi:disease resistance protein RPV1-like isoform X4 [Malus sylvestris]|uniref:disease resistance protein RPV1-like isoform X4 n=1 Tax=Malus sylvestris TaxID=3752 RepID=UPI0021AC00E6|nr:disease resistance protein RPV1-like isoform X4 [Malus sylvestris]